MSLLRFLNIQGVAGLAAGVALAVLLVMQIGQTRHWKKESGRFEQLYTREQSALAETVASFRAAAQQAEASDRANAARVAADQRAINERTSDAYQTRLAAARSLAQRLRDGTETATDPGAGRSAPMPGFPAAPGGSNRTADEDRLPQSDALVATEQAIQLDELIKWVKAQAAVDPNAKAEAH